MESIAELEKKVEQMKAESENAAEELIRLRVQHQSLKAQNQGLTQQVAQFVQRSRDQERILRNTRQELFQLREEFDNEANIPHDYNRRDFTLPLHHHHQQQSATFYTNVISDVPLPRNPLLQTTAMNPASLTTAATAVASPLLPLPSNEIHKGALTSSTTSVIEHRPILPTNHTSSLGNIHTLPINPAYLQQPTYYETFVATKPYSSLSSNPRFDMGSYVHPAMLTPSLSPPATSLSPRLDGSMIISEEGPSEFRSLEGVLEPAVGVEDGARHDSNALSLAELFGDEMERLHERRTKRCRSE